VEASPGMRKTGGRCLEFVALDFEIVESRRIFG